MLIIYHVNFKRAYDGTFLLGHPVAEQRMCTQSRKKLIESKLFKNLAIKTSDQIVIDHPLEIFCIEIKFFPKPIPDIFFCPSIKLKNWFYFALCPQAGSTTPPTSCSCSTWSR